MSSPHVENNMRCLPFLVLLTTHQSHGDGMSYQEEEFEVNDVYLLVNYKSDLFLKEEMVEEKVW